MLRVAIIGCGKMGRIHAAHLRALDAEVACACDAEVSSAEQLAAAHPGAIAVRDAERIDWSSIDAAVISTPPFARGPAEVAAIGAGVPIFVEKPIGLSAVHAEPILAALAARPVITSAGYMQRYRASVRGVRARLLEEKLRAISCSWVGKEYRRSWWLDPSASGGPFNEQATHLVDLCRYWGGELDRVSAVCEGATALAASLVFQSGALATILWRTGAESKLIGVEVITERASVRLEGWELSSAESEDAIYARELEVFLSAVRARDPHPRAIASTFGDAVRTQRAVDAIRRAAESGRVEPVR